MIGGARPGAGRKPGVENKAKEMLKGLITDADVKLALSTLRKSMRSSNLKAAITASTYLLDQKFGKASQAVDVTSGGKPIREVRWSLVGDEGHQRSDENKEGN